MRRRLHCVLILLIMIFLPVTILGVTLSSANMSVSARKYGTEMSGNSVIQIEINAYGGNLLSPAGNNQVGLTKDMVNISTPVISWSLSGNNYNQVTVTFTFSPLVNDSDSSKRLGYTISGALDTPRIGMSLLPTTFSDGTYTGTVSFSGVSSRTFTTTSQNTSTIIVNCLMKKSSSTASARHWIQTGTFSVKLASITNLASGRYFAPIYVGITAN